MHSAAVGINRRAAGRPQVQRLTQTQPGHRNGLDAAVPIHLHFLPNFLSKFHAFFSSGFFCFAFCCFALVA